MSIVLLSINPIHSEKILNGTKTFEYRRVLPKLPFDKVVIYETSPTMKIVGECRVDYVIQGKPRDVWKRTRAFGGTDAKSFKAYFAGVTCAYAIHLSDAKKYDAPLSLSDYGIRRAPQSFCYLEK